MVAFTLIQRCVLCAKKDKAGATSIVTPGQYSGDLKSDPSKTGIIRKPDILEVGFRMVGFQMVGFQMVGTIAIAIVPTI